MAYGWANPALAYLFSFLGSLLALMLAIRARERTGVARFRTLLLSAVVLGSTGVWLTHFVAMIGFDVPSLTLRYDLLRTALSLGLAVSMVAFGLLVVGLGRRPSLGRVLIGGPVTGLGVAAMHYTGMGAIHLSGAITYDRDLVVASLVIAVVAATVALFLAMVVRSATSIVVAALAMALAVCSMHYTAMAAVRVEPSEVVRNLPGVSPVTLAVPILAVACLLVVGIFYSLAGRPDETGSKARHRAPAHAAEPESLPVRVPVRPAYAPVFPFDTPEFAPLPSVGRAAGPAPALPSRPPAPAPPSHPAPGAPSGRSAPAPRSGTLAPGSPSGPPASVPPPGGPRSALAPDPSAPDPSAPAPPAGPPRPSSPPGLASRYRNRPPRYSGPT
jgi:NO-binding membrane sensor protein with MHYT domain